MSIVTLKLPIGQIKKAVNAVREAHSIIKLCESEAANWGTEQETLIKSGTEGIKRRADALTGIDKRKTEATASAIGAIEAAAKDAFAMIDEQVTPNGDDIIGANAADFALLSAGLIVNAEQLNRLLAKHDNVAFRIAAAQYARARDWDGFNFYDKEQSAREFTKQVFDNLKVGANYPNGAAYMQYCETDNEYSRIANEYGLTDEFALSGGADM